MALRFALAWLSGDGSISGYGAHGFLSLRSGRGIETGAEIRKGGAT